ncbi:hypothetical protein SAMN05518672_10467 [Chitinophaga sp. CF118]|uniref:hypothetical protein n=1 Tax=Chitinophaga sp. CF118 TaxID=1884367 RepID=UPI0008EBC915|nr:hypothetical protein [Chitinophaga sp. CF118]SFD99166.1 hypothetical protein SAMN05518672_10467 [Chitinophaga sp. CF118]
MTDNSSQDHHNHCNVPASFHNLPFVYCQELANANGKIEVSIMVPALKGSTLTCVFNGDASYTITIVPPAHHHHHYEIYTFNESHTPIPGETEVLVRTVIDGPPNGTERGTVSLPDSVHFPR